MTDVKMTIDDVLALGHVMPVIVIEDAAKAVPLAETLLANDIRTIEITLRTPAALDSIAAIADQCPDMVVGAGTILSPELAQASASAGARFVGVLLAEPAALGSTKQNLMGRPALLILSITAVYG
ncbi:MAG: hypothetical protein ACPID7_00915, partial [Candidatus Puniceispirillum sp.]